MPWCKCIIHYLFSAARLLYLTTEKNSVSGCVFENQTNPWPQLTTFSPCPISGRWVFFLFNMYWCCCKDSEDSEYALKKYWLLERQREREGKKKPCKPHGEIMSRAHPHNLFCPFLCDWWAERIHVELALFGCSESALTSLKGRVNGRGVGELLAAIRMMKWNFKLH